MKSFVFWKGILVRSLMLIITLSINSPPIASKAGSTCQMTYVVQSGDSLIIVANRFTIPVETLVAANARYKNGKLHPGVKLCIPLLPIVGGHVTFESAFVYQPDREEALWSLTRGPVYTGHRLPLPLESLYPIEVVTQTIDFATTVSSAITNRSLPLLLGTISSLTRNSYQLIVVDQPELLKSLRFSDTVAFTPTLGTTFAISDVLSAENTLSAELKLWVEFPDASRYPYLINTVRFAPGDAEAIRRDLNIAPDLLAFALIPSDNEPGRYRFVALVTRSSGPGGGPTYEFCRAVPRRGFWGWFRAWVCR